MTPRERIYAAITAERERQDRLHPETDAFVDGTGGLLYEALRDTAKLQCEVAVATHGTCSFGFVLLEEVYEALAEENPLMLAKELTEVAAVCVRWLEAIHRRFPGG